MVGAYYGPFVWQRAFVGIMATVEYKFQSAFRCQMTELREIDRVVVINDSSVARGGATAIAIANATELAKLGIRVTYICGDSGKSATDLRKAGIEVLPMQFETLSKDRGVRAAVNGLFNIEVFSLLRRWIAKFDSPRTIYHLHNWHHVLSPSALAALKPVFSRTLLHAHDLFLVCPNGALMDYVKGQPCNLKPMGVSCVTTNCDKRSYAHKLWRVARQSIKTSTVDLSASEVDTFIIHERLREPLKAAGQRGPKLITLPNPSKAFTSTRVVAERNKSLIFIGRLAKEKGPREFLEACKAVQTPALVVGDGLLKRELENDFPDAEFFGWLTHAEIGHLVVRARALVIPSLYPEPYGLVAVEALQSGLPVLIAQDAYLASEVTTNGVGGSINPHDAGSMASTLRQFSCDLNNDNVEMMSKKAISVSGRLTLSNEDWINKIVYTYLRKLEKNIEVEDVKWQQP